MGWLSKLASFESFCDQHHHHQEVCQYVHCQRSQVFQSKAEEDDRRINQLEKDLKEAREKAEAADATYEEVICNQHNQHQWSAKIQPEAPTRNLDPEGPQDF